MTVADDLADQTIRQAAECGPRKSILCALIRSAGRMLAETEGHDFAARVHSQEVRHHMHAENCKGVRRR